MEFVNDLIPRYATADLDGVAEQFLKEYWREALETPIPVPIKAIMVGLDKIKKK